jgi:hypothetical protein
MLNVVVAAVQKIKTKSNGAVLEEAKIMVFTKKKKGLNLMEQYGH